MKRKTKMRTSMSVLVAAFAAVAGCRSAVKEFYDPLVNGEQCTGGHGGAGGSSGAGGSGGATGGDGGGGHPEVAGSGCSLQ